jgi:hypothetical protein
VRPHPLLWGGLLVNLPAFVTGGLSTALLDGLTVPPYRSTRVAAWLGTAVFFLVATVQWIVLGILGTRITKWVLSRRTAWR